MALLAGLLAGSSSPVSADENGQDLLASDHDHCELEGPGVDDYAGPVPTKPRERASLGEDAPPLVRRVRSTGSLALDTVGQGAAGGALAGKTVYVSAGHGWIYANRWTTQRGNTNGIIEDFVSAEAINQLLLQYLINMGAYVVPVRESDMSSQRVIVDDADSAFQITGTASALAEGFATPNFPIQDAGNPFRAGQSQILTAAADASAEASWSFDVAETGDYNVYVGWVQDPSRASDAHYTVAHAGGEAHFRVDQRRHGSTWVLLGRFHFRADDPEERRTLKLSNDSASPGATLSADVARIGGGLGVIGRAGETNERPMYEHAARYYTQWAGAPSTVWDSSSTDGNDDVGSRSRFAAWEHEAGEDAVYIAWHSNAPNPGRGTESYAYGPGPPPQPLSSFTGVPGSLQLMDAIHSTLVNDLRAGWDAGWSDRGQHTAYFGEVNPNHNPEMPATLIEIGFHDTPADAEALLDPRFRHIAARALANGVARYFAGQDGQALVLPPAPPEGLSLINTGDGLEACWRTPGTGDAATGFRLYLSTDGRAFDDGQPVTGSCTTLSGLEPGTTVYARVSATNEGGESFPSELVGARLAPSGAAAVLVIGGFQRLDGNMSVSEDLSAFGLGTVQRGLMSRMNDGSHASRHGAALASAEVSFDGATASALQGDSGPDLATYQMIDWYLGEESSGNDPLNSDERASIAQYLEGGGILMLSGSEIGWALVEKGSAETQAFFRDVLRAEYVADDAETYEVVGSAASFSSAMLRFDDFGPGSYNADFPDVLAAASGSQVVLNYADGRGAGTLWNDDTTGAGVLLLGFPFETIDGAGARAELMTAALAEFGIEPDRIDDEDDDDDTTDEEEEDAGVNGGCGCGVTSTPPWGSAAALLLTWLLLAYRRKRRLLPGSQSSRPIASKKPSRWFQDCHVLSRMES